MIDLHALKNPRLSGYNYVSATIGDPSRAEPKHRGSCDQCFAILGPLAIQAGLHDCLRSQEQRVGTVPKRLLRPYVLEVAKKTVHFALVADV